MSHSNIVAGSRGSFGAGLLACLFVLGAVSGCGGYTKQMEAARQAYESHQFDLAATYLAGELMDAEERDGLLFRLEYGSALRAAGDWQGSLATFQDADGIWEEMQGRADLDLSDETLATLTKQSKLPYRGQAYDGIMMNLYMAMNYMAVGDLENARVQIDRTYIRQQEAVARNAERIEKAEAAAVSAAEDEENGYDASRTQEDEQFQSRQQEVYAELEADTERFSAYTNYVNPYAQFMRGLFLMSCGYDADDLQNAQTIFTQLRGMVPDTGYVDADVALSEQVARGGELPPMTYVIFESGRAPLRESVRIDLPIFIIGGDVDYVGAAFPVLDKQDAVQVYSGLTAVAGGESYPTKLLCSMDGVISREFKNDLPLIITRTLISTGVKATAAYALNKATENDTWVNLATRVTATVYQAYMNEADLRTWTLLPKEVHYARLPTPSSGFVDVALPDGQSFVVEVDSEAKVNLIVVKSVRAGLVPSIHRMTLPNPSEAMIVQPSVPVVLKGDGA